MEHGTSGRRIAVVGSGIAGLGAARRLEHQGHRVTLFEANAQAGGHSNTVDVRLDGRVAPVDTGFLVFNDRTYPELLKLFADLGVQSAPSEMSFSLRNDEDGIEWAGTNFASLFAQRRNALRPAFWRMLSQIARFNRAALDAVASGPSTNADESLGGYLALNGYGREFREWYLIPMAAAIWSSPRADIEDFPLRSFARFCANHGLLQLRDRPQWRTVIGGSRDYVQRIVSGLSDVRVDCPVTGIRRQHGTVRIRYSDHGCATSEKFDQVVLACHADQALRLLDDPSAGERALLGAIRFQPNRAVLHSDASLMPRSRRAWSAWNYLSAIDPE
ncbi:MAG: FAD-dependent oxidoreductase, partial [Casimicrobiaceae bacterium]